MAAERLRIPLANYAGARLQSTQPNFLDQTAVGHNTSEAVGRQQCSPSTPVRQYLVSCGVTQYTQTIARSVLSRDFAPYFIPPPRADLASDVRFGDTSMRELRFRLSSILNFRPDPVLSGLTDIAPSLSQPVNDGPSSNGERCRQPASRQRSDRSLAFAVVFCVLLAGCVTPKRAGMVVPSRCLKLTAASFTQPCAQRSDGKLICDRVVVTATCVEVSQR